MRQKTEDQFRAELEEAKKALENEGRQVSVGDSLHDDGGLSCDFELPYSSLPTIRSERWH